MTVRGKGKLIVFARLERLDCECSNRILTQ